MMANDLGTKLYTGCSSDLPGRVLKHKTKFYSNGFTAINRCHKLVYYEYFPTITEAYAEEQRIKGGSRRKKDKMVNSMNPEWKDLYDDLVS